MRPMTDSIPKALARCGEHTLLEEQMEFLRAWVDNVHVTVGYLANMVRETAIDAGAASVVDIGDHENAWWIGRTPLGQLQEPIVVITCDNFMEIDIQELWKEYESFEEPPCMVIPTQPVEGTSGDFIFQSDGVVTKLSRSETSDLYCCGLQILNPGAIAALAPQAMSFHQVWTALIHEGALMTASTQPERWLAVDTVEQLTEIDTWLVQEASPSNS